MVLIIAGVVVSAAVADGVPEEAGGDPAAGAAAPARLRARRPARHALPRRPLQAQEGGQGRHQGRIGDSSHKSLFSTGLGRSMGLNQDP